MRGQKKRTGSQIDARDPTLLSLIDCFDRYSAALHFQHPRAGVELMKETLKVFLICGLCVSRGNLRKVPEIRSQFQNRIAPFCSIVGENPNSSIIVAV
jgi:hypothetical protein